MTEKYNVVVFGDLPVATKIVQYLQTMDDVHISVVIGNKSPNNNDPWKDTPLLYDYAIEARLEILTLDDISTKYEDNYFTLGMSCRFSKIIKLDVLSKFKNGILNMHGGLLPEFGGLYSVNHTLLTHSKVGGGTIHYIDESVDTGEIVKRAEFDVCDDDTAYSLFQKTQIGLVESMIEVIPAALHARIKGVSHSEMCAKGYAKHYYNKHSLDGKKELKASDLSSEDAMYIIRAFDFPGYEPAYYVNDCGRKIYLRYKY